MNRPAWLVYALAVAVTLLLVALILGGCAAHKPADKPFCLAFHDDLGLGASFTVIAYYQSSVKQISATLPPNGDVVVEIGETPPQGISILGAIWSAGIGQFQQAESYTYPQYAKWELLHVLYPSGVIWGEFAR